MEIYVNDFLNALDCEISFVLNCTRSQKFSKGSATHSANDAMAHGSRLKMRIFPPHHHPATESSWGTNVEEAAPPFMFHQDEA